MLFDKETTVLKPEYGKDFNYLFKLFNWKIHISSRRTKLPKQDALSSYKELETFIHLHADAMEIYPINEEAPLELRLYSCDKDSWEVGTLSPMALELEIPESQIQTIAANTEAIKYIYILADERREPHSEIQTVYRADFVTIRNELTDLHIQGSQVT